MGKCSVDLDVTVICTSKVSVFSNPHIVCVNIRLIVVSMPLIPAFDGVLSTTRLDTET